MSLTPDLHPEAALAAVEVCKVSKHYSLSGSQMARLRQVFAPGKQDAKAGLWALRDVSFSVKRGEAFGIIGANGSGKSTLLQIVAGILRPTSGSVEISGRLSALLELGSGFSPEFTGRDNVYLNGSLLGLSRAEIDARFSDIERFAGIGAFIDQPIKTYSTGMVLRLAFAVSAHVDPEILIVDEALAVGDISFRQRCMRKIHDMRARGLTLLFVSHEATDVKALCDRCVWLQNGEVRELGETDDVVTKYIAATLKKEISHAPEKVLEAAGTEVTHAPDLQEQTVTGFDAPFTGRQWGDGRATIIGGALVDPAGERVRTVRPLQPVILRMSMLANVTLESPIVGFLLRNSKGENMFGSNTARENYPLPAFPAGEINTVDFHWTMPDLAPGRYYLAPGVADGNLLGFQMCDHLDDAIPVDVGEAGAGQSGTGYFRLGCDAIAVHRHAGDLSPVSSGQHCK